MIRLTFLLGSLLLASVASADERYVALGDSLPFGYNPLVQPPNLHEFAGYPKFVAAALELHLLNASCIGETSTSFITGLAKDDLTPFIPSEGCQNYRAHFPLFVNYKGPQLGYAIAQLRVHEKTELVTLSIGGNDLAVLQFGCNFDVACEIAGLPGVLATFAGNLTNILARIRGEAGYEGQIVFLTYYSFNYSDPISTGAIALLNSTAASVGAQYNVSIADGFGAFATASVPYGGDVCKAGLLIKLPNGTCDTHPSPAGQKLLAATVILAAHSD